jgi:hypothetical protein
MKTSWSLGKVCRRFGGTSVNLHPGKIAKGLGRYKGNNDFFGLSAAEVAQCKSVTRYFFQLSCKVENRPRKAATRWNSRDAPKKYTSQPTTDSPGLYRSSFLLPNTYKRTRAPHRQGKSLLGRIIHIRTAKATINIVTRISEHQTGFRLVSRFIGHSPV